MTSHDRPATLARRKAPRTLRSRLAFAIGLLVATSLAIAAVAVTGVSRMHKDYGLALRGYGQLREVYEVGVHVEHAADHLARPAPDPDAVHDDVRRARQKLALFLSPSRSGDAWLASTQDEAEAIRAELDAAEAELRLAPHSPALGRVTAQLAAVAGEVQRTIRDRQAAAAAERRRMLTIIAAVSGALVLLAGVVGARHYRSIVRPVDRLGSAVRRFASGDRDARVDVAGADGREFAALAGDFNQMAAELAGLHRDLEQKVLAKSRELVRSERLASVGYLAAGVAHEINNPLGIIAAYAERSLQQLRRQGRRAGERGGDDGTLARIEQTLEVVCEESFRCKAITDRLLTLARPGPADRRVTPLDAIARDVIATLAGLPQYRAAKLVLECSAGPEPTALVHEGEMKQVILNLLVNALEACEGGGREPQVRVAVSRIDGPAPQVRLAVSDNGRGMAPETAERVFEPFFTTNRQPSRPGTGLGLSVCHAIVEAHGGRLAAESAGVGLGSQFTVWLPAAAHPADGSAAAATEKGGPRVERA